MFFFVRFLFCLQKNYHNSTTDDWVQNIFFKDFCFFHRKITGENYLRIILAIIFAAMALRLHEEGRELRRATDFHAEFAPEACRMDLHMLWVLLARKGMHPAERMNRALQSVHGRTSYQVRLGAECADPYWPGKSLREGCPTSPILFNILHDESLRQAREERDKHALTHGLGDVGLQWDSTQPGRPSKQRSGQGRKRWDGHSVPLSRTLERSSGQEAEPTGTAMKLCDGPENVAKREWLELGG